MSKIKKAPSILQHKAGGFPGASHKKAYFLYEILEKLEVGIELTGTEVKSVYAGDLNFSDAWVSIEKGEAWLEHFHIGTWEHASINNHIPLRRRRLLLHKREIVRWEKKEKGLTIVPLAIYSKNQFIKIEIGLARGKKEYDKRETIKKREADRDISREMK